MQHDTKGLKKLLKALSKLKQHTMRKGKTFISKDNNSSSYHLLVLAPQYFTLI